MFKNAYSEDSVFGANSHLFLPAVVLSLVEIFLSHYYVSSPFSFQFGGYRRFSFGMSVSLQATARFSPFCFSDQSRFPWSTRPSGSPFSWQLSSTCSSTKVPCNSAHLQPRITGFLYFSLLSSTVFFVCLTIHKTGQKQNQRIIPIEV